MRFHDSPEAALHCNLVSSVASIDDAKAMAPTSPAFAKTPMAMAVKVASSGRPPARTRSQSKVAADGRPVKKSAMKRPDPSIPLRRQSLDPQAMLQPVEDLLVAPALGDRRRYAAELFPLCAFGFLEAQATSASLSGPSPHAGRRPGRLRWW